MGLFDRLKKKLKNDEDELIIIKIYECVIAAYYENRDEDEAWPLDELDDSDPIGNLELLAEWLPDYFEYDGSDNKGVVYISPEATGIKTLKKNDLKNEFGLIADTTKKAGEELHNILERYGALEGNETLRGIELRTQNIQPEAILIPDSNIVLLHCEIGIKYAIS